MTGKEYLDVIVHIPLEEEFREFISIFPTKENISTDVHVAYIVQAPSDLKIAVILQNAMGRSAASNTCAHMLSRYTCRLYICLGIAGGLTKDLALGDVCYTGSLIDVYDNSKVTDIEGGGVDISFSPEHYETKDFVTAAIGFVRTMTELNSLLDYWTEDQAAFVERTLTTSVPGRDGQQEVIGSPKCLNGDIVCGAVSESDYYKKKLKGITRNILAIETESGAVFDLCGQSGIEALTIRGLSDYADRSKGKLEGASKNAVRKIAARNAASFLHMQLQSPVFLRAFAKLGSGEATSPRLPLPEAPAALELPALIDSLAVEIDTKLRELSPQYRSKPTAYRLPTPRLRPCSGSTSDSRKRPPALELSEALTQNRRILVHVPRAYPDPALSYIMASGLILTDLGAKKLVPVVIQGADIAPPNNGLFRSSKINLPPDLSGAGGEYVFIIDSPTINSKTKRHFLIDEIKKLTDGRVIIVTRDEKSLVEETDFQRSIAAESFDVCAVSFAEMAVFLENSFEIPSSEAEVIALKLRNLFERFSLPSHPSFFAGIPSETFSALLLANRRSELIQLAVDGFLSFIVADDLDRVRLSRTTRASFLKKLAVDVLVEKRRFSRSELVQYAEDMSTEYDYGIQPISFINSFEEKGLIHFEAGSVSITLPFMRSYLLASALSENEALAVRYFDASNDDFDLLTFDLYCELGPSGTVQAAIVAALSAAMSDPMLAYEQHTLLSGAVYPRILKTPARINSLQRRITAARQDLDEDASDRVEKVKILEIVDRVNEDIAASLDKDKPAGDLSEDANEPLTNLIRIWVISTVLLGSGAENIRGSDRQEISTLILKAADSILSSWTKLFSEIDYESIKNSISRDSQFKQSTTLSDGDEFEKVLSSLVEFVEYMSLSFPLERIINHLLDQAQQTIIGNSVAKVTPDGALGPLLKGLWLSNIDKKMGEETLNAAVRDLPDARFLRMILTYLLIYRIKWKLSSKPLRYYLLDVAQEVIRPLNPNLNKGELQRLVDASSKELLDGRVGDEE